MARRSSGAGVGGMSVSELLAALTLAQRDRETAMEELKRVSEGERKKVKQGEEKAERLMTELEEARRKAEDLSIKCEEVEARLKTEREINERRQTEEEAFLGKVDKWKERVEQLNRTNQELGNANAGLSEELALTKGKLHKVMNSEEQLKDEIKQLKDTLESSKGALDKSLRSQEILDSEVHMYKMQLLKETNISSRVLDELKRARKEIDGYREEVGRLRKGKETYESSLSQQIRELSILVAEWNKESYRDELKEIRFNLSTILKENFTLNTRLSGLQDFLTRGSAEGADEGTQTSVGFDEMERYARMEREVMGLQEDLFAKKTEILGVREENRELKASLAKISRDWRQQEEMEEEEHRVERLERAVRSLHRLLIDSGGGGVERDQWRQEPVEEEKQRVERLEGAVRSLHRLLIESGGGEVERDMRRQEPVEEENQRVERLEGAVRSLHHLLMDSGRGDIGREILEKVQHLQEDVDHWKRGKWQRQTNKEVSRGQTLRPTHLVTTRKY